MLRKRLAAILVAALALAVPVGAVQAHDAAFHGAKIPRPATLPGLAKSAPAPSAPLLQRLTAALNESPYAELRVSQRADGAPFALNGKKGSQEKFMKTRNVVLASVFAAAGLCLAIAPASAYTACNRDGDCWHTDTRVHVPGITLSFHNDKWWDTHRSNARYHWHDADAGHDWHHGYWSHGEWHSS